MSADLGDIIRVVDLVGVAVNGLLGGEIARRERLDPIGFAVLGILSALGGGMLRDTLLQRGTPVALTDPWYLVVALFAALVAFVVPFEGRTWNAIYPSLDGLALGTWAAVGTQKALLLDIHWFPAILLGVLTACGGGVVRDVMLGSVPAILQRSELYATAAFAGGASFVLLQLVTTDPLASLGALLIGGGVCDLARRRGWMLPTEPKWRPSRVHRR